MKSMTNTEYQRWLQQLRNKQKQSDSDKKTIRAIEILLQARDKFSEQKH